MSLDVSSGFTHHRYTGTNSVPRRPLDEMPCHIHAGPDTTVYLVMSHQTNPFTKCYYLYMHHITAALEQRYAYV